MLRKRAKRRAAGEQGKARATRARYALASAMPERLTVASDQGTATKRLEARLKNAARVALQKMGED